MEDSNWRLAVISRPLIMHVVDSTTSISDVTLKLTLSTARSIQKGFAFFNFSRESSCFAFRDSNLLTDLCFCASFILKELDGLTKLGLIALDALQSFSIGFVCMVKTNFKLVDFSLKLFLDSESLALSTLLCLNGCSKRVHSTSMIFPGVVELIFLFSNTSVNILSDLTKFQLCSKNLVFFHLKSSFCLL